MGVVCDLDGVIWLGAEPIPGAAAAVERLRAAEHEIVFVTNNAATPIADQEAKLAQFGIAATGAVIGAAVAGASLLAPSERVLVVGEAGLREAVADRGAEIVDDGPADAVIVGLDRSFDYDTLRRAAATIRAGARFVATNTDATFPTPAGLVPGAGSLVAAVTAASGTAPLVAGKPHRPIVDLVRGRLGSDGVVIGDRDDTDGAFARALGYRFALALSGVTTAAAIPTDPAPDWVGADLADLADQLIDGDGPQERRPPN